VLLCLSPLSAVLFLFLSALTHLLSVRSKNKIVRTHGRT
jgi:hypothetical protein